MSRKISMKERIRVIKKRRGELQAAANQLKKDFVGLDRIIDRVISSIEAWYCIPEAISSPVIVCLWGLTGVGKTQLVRNLVRYLKFDERYVEVLMSTGSQSSSTSLSSIRSHLCDSDIQTEEPGVLLLDEIQRFRTVDEHGAMKDRYAFDDVWTLLSDGRFAGVGGIRSQIEQEYEELVMQELREDYDREFKRRKQELEKQREAEQSQLANAIEEVKKAVSGMEGVTRADGAVPETTAPSDDPPSEEEVDMSDVGPNPWRFSLWGAKRLKRLLKLKMPVIDIAKMDRRAKMQLLADALDDPDVWGNTDFSKLLIFISGNLDEAFTDAFDVDDPDANADIVHERTKKVTIVHIKDALLNRFKPEQIARFGNTHVIYPSLASAAYSELISRKLAEAQKMSKERTGIELIFDESVSDLIYENGVFPAQGTRPVFTTANEVVSASMSKAILDAAEHACRKTRISYDLDKRHFVCKCSKNTIYIPYIGAVNEIRRQLMNDKNRSALIAVHESGHVLAYALLTGCVPAQIAPKSAYKSGFVVRHPSLDSYQSELDFIAISLAGNEAENAVFGVAESSLGSANDFFKATQCASDLIRCHLSGEQAAVTGVELGDQMGIPHISTNHKVGNAQIEKIMKEQRQRARELVHQKERLLADMSKLLFGATKVDPLDVQRLFRAHGIEVRVPAKTEVLCSDYSNKLELFCNDFGQTVEVGVEEGDE